MILPKLPVVIFTSTATTSTSPRTSPPTSRTPTTSAIPTKSVPTLGAALKHRKRLFRKLWTLGYRELSRKVGPFLFRRHAVSSLLFKNQKRSISRGSSRTRIIENNLRSMEKVPLQSPQEKAWITRRTAEKALR